MTNHAVSHVGNDTYNFNLPFNGNLLALRYLKSDHECISK